MFKQLNMLISISYVTLSLGLAVMSLMLMYRLRTRFHGLYTDYGCSLWKVIITQIISLFIGASFYLLYYYCIAWEKYWYDNVARAMSFTTITALCTFIIPMIS